MPCFLCRQVSSLGSKGVFGEDELLRCEPRKFKVVCEQAGYLWYMAGVDFLDLLSKMDKIKEEVILELQRKQTQIDFLQQAIDSAQSFIQQSQSKEIEGNQSYISEFQMLQAKKQRSVSQKHSPTSNASAPIPKTHRGKQYSHTNSKRLLNSSLLLSEKSSIS